MNSKRDEWFKSLELEHLKVIEQVVDITGESQMPEQFTVMAKHVLANVYKLSQRNREMVEKLELFKQMEGEFLAESSSRKVLSNVNDKMTES